MRRRTVVAALSGVATLTAAAVALVAPPAEAQVGDEGAAALAGNFVGGPEEELFLYASGSGEDGLVLSSNGGVPGGEVLFEFFPFAVNGFYSPEVGDFDGNGYDEIFWYAPGTAADYRWQFTSTTSITSTRQTVNGANFWPVAGDYLGDGTDDILWYSPGTAQDYLWDYNAGGGFTSSPRQISGSYWPVAGSFGSDETDDVFWYGPGGVADAIWDFHPNGSHTDVRPQQVGGSTYRPFELDLFAEGLGSEDIFWYAPGSTPDTIWDYFGGVKVQEHSQPVGGDYPLTAAGDFLGDGCADVFWFGLDGFNLWDYSCTAEGADRYDYNFFLAAAEARSAASSGGGPFASMPDRVSAVPGPSLTND